MTYLDNTLDGNTECHHLNGNTIRVGGVGDPKIGVYECDGIGDAINRVTTKGVKSKISSFLTLSFFAFYLGDYTVPNLMAF